MMRKCIECLVEKALSEFPIHSGTHRRTRCKPCYKVYNTTVKRSGYDKERNRRTMLLRNYGISYEEYLEMHDRQNGVCAICNQPETRRREGEGVSLLAVDHDHDTGKVRGLQCYRCNLMLGYAKDNSETLKRAINYLGETG